MPAPEPDVESAGRWSSLAMPIWFGEGKPAYDKLTFWSGDKADDLGEDAGWVDGSWPDEDASGEDDFDEDYYDWADDSWSDDNETLYGEGSEDDLGEDAWWVDDGWSDEDASGEDDFDEDYYDWADDSWSDDDETLYGGGSEDDLGDEAEWVDWIVDDSVGDPTDVYAAEGSEEPLVVNCVMHGPDGSDVVSVEDVIAVGDPGLGAPSATDLDMII
jgi:hypothetical protein